MKNNELAQSQKEHLLVGKRINIDRGKFKGQNTLTVIFSVASTGKQS